MPVSGSGILKIRCQYPAEYVGANDLERYALQVFTIQGTGSKTQTGETIFQICLEADSSLLLDVSGGQAKNRANMQLWKDNGIPAQRFTAKQSADDSHVYTFISQASKTPYAVETTGFSKRPEENVELWRENGGPNQQWRLHPFKKLTEDSLSASTEVKTYRYGTSSILVTILNSSTKEGGVGLGSELQRYDPHLEKWISCPSNEPEVVGEGAWIIDAVTGSSTTFSLEDYEINGKLPVGRYRHILDKKYITEFIIE